MPARLLFCLILLVAPIGVVAQDLAVLLKPGTIVVMRHALAPGTGDPKTFRIDDCSTQRNLDAEGRAQASKIGKRFRAAGVRFDHVWNSRWCRARDTAKLLDVGPPQDRKALDSFFAHRDQGAAQTAQTLELIRALPHSDTAILVTHQVNITALTGRRLRSGEIVVIERSGDGTLSVTDEISF
ncbi:histidine phosphatase family protein [Sulfitobacter sp. D35]|uniref:histidine phosphatase family protein n=1 Tax=Sulfitobacter sp. D35 TaxID=3083252 RepID=UPI00296FC10A|nr:histidine phosphatase family protein [Sulfitobacter sp. D35]MDW4497839.1 histidine phosphatase family protein [Sulfitobacter sp. D35]